MKKTFYIFFLFVSIYRLSFSSELTKYKEEAGVFLYAPCSFQDRKEWCVLLTQNNYSNSFFATPGGTVVLTNRDLAETASRGANEETGHLLNLRAQDLETEGSNFVTIKGVTQSNYRKREEVDYTLFFKQIHPYLAAQFLQAEQRTYKQKNHNTYEILGYAWVPFSVLRKYLESNQNGSIKIPESLFAEKHIITEGQSSGEQMINIHLLPGFENIFRQPEMSAILNRIASKPMPSDVQDKQTLLKQIRSGKLNPDPAIASRIASQVLGSTYQITKEDKAYYHHNKFVDPSLLPFTASEAQLRLLMSNLESNESYLDPNIHPFEQIVNLFLDNYALDGMEKVTRSDITPHVRQLVAKILAKEKEERGSWVMYHAMSSFKAFIMDVLTEIRTQLSLKDTPQPNIALIWDQAFDELEVHTMDQFHQKALGRMDPDVAQSINLSSERKREYVLSKAYAYINSSAQLLALNIALFGNNNNPLEDTFSYWISNHHNLFQSFQNLKKFLTSMGIRDIDSYKELFDTLKRENLAPNKGRLLQLVFAPSEIDRLVYIAAGNRPLEFSSPQEGNPNFEESRPSYILELLRKNPRLLEDKLKNSILESYSADTIRPKVTWLQGRLLPHNNIPYSTENLRIFIYDLDERTEEQKKQYFTAIRQLVEKHLAGAVKEGLNNFKFHGDIDQPPLMKNYQGPVKRPPTPEQIITWVDKPSSATDEKILEYVQEFKYSLEGFHLKNSPNRPLLLLGELAKKQRWHLIIEILNIFIKLKEEGKRTSKDISVENNHPRERLLFIESVGMVEIKDFYRITYLLKTALDESQYFSFLKNLVITLADETRIGNPSPRISGIEFINRIGATIRAARQVKENLDTELIEYIIKQAFHSGPQMVNLYLMNFVMEKFNITLQTWEMGFLNLLRYQSLTPEDLGKFLSLSLSKFNAEGSPYEEKDFYIKNSTYSELVYRELSDKPHHLLLKQEIKKFTNELDEKRFPNLKMSLEFFVN